LIADKFHRANPTLFEFRDAEGRVLWVQERVFGDVLGLKKSDFPWSHWSDGRWRNMEPDGPLPLYGLDQNLADAYTVFIHEGAKTAKYLRFMTGTEADVDYQEHPWLLKENCPWGKQLTDHAVHIGWPGGAPNPHRVDWTPIRELSLHTRVILVCD